MTGNGLKLLELLDNDNASDNDKNEDNDDDYDGDEGDDEESKCALITVLIVFVLALWL